MEIQIMDLVGDLNNKDFTKKQILEKYKITDYTLKKLLKTNGYKYNPKLNQWLLESENTDVDTTKVTYRIPTELITKVLETYIPKETMEIVKQNKK